MVYNPKPTDLIIQKVTSEQVPVLDLFSYINGVDGEAEQLASDLRYIQENLGFYYIINHGVSNKLIEKAFEQVRLFFGLPDSEKNRIMVNENQVGFVPSKASIMKTELTKENTMPDINEGFSLMREREPNDPKVLAGVRFSGLNQWPEGVPKLKEILLKYHLEMEKLGKRLLPLYALALEKPLEYFNPFFEDAHYYNRNSMYTAVKEPGKHEALGAHTDHNFLALLPMSEEPGLMYATPSGNWLKAPKVPGAIVVNTGEFLKRWTNGRFLPTPHRVTIPRRNRYSLTFHYSPSDETEAIPLDTCVSPGNPPIYEPKTFIQHMTDYIDAVYVPQKEMMEC